MKFTEHPLFPAASEDDDPPEVEAIHVSRFEGGRQPWCSHLFAAEELTSLEAIYDLFGGGSYELIARSGSRISTRRRYEIAGRSKPLVFGAVEPEAVPVMAAPPQMALPQDAGMMGLLVQMFQAQQAQTAQTMQLMMQSSSQNLTAMTGMMTAMLSRDGDGNKTLIQALQSNNDRALAGQAQVFEAMLKSVSGGGQGVVGALKDGIELGQKMGAITNGDAPDGDDLGDTMNSVIQGLKMATELTGGTVPDGAAELDQAS